MTHRKKKIAWAYSDMLGLDPEVVVHHLVVQIDTKLVTQKLRKMHPQIALLVKLELQKLLELGFIQPIDYPEWVSNIIPISKPNGDIRMCIDFRDLNKACLKDDFPLPNIDLIMDQTIGHKMLSLTDGFLGYNQIMIAQEDQHKTTFTCAWGTYCWIMMSFRLKNTGATYERAMTLIFHYMMHKAMEYYVDDILAKSKKRREHIDLLS